MCAVEQIVKQSGAYQAYKAVSGGSDKERKQGRRQQQSLMGQGPIGGSLAARAMKGQTGVTSLLGGL